MNVRVRLWPPYSAKANYNIEWEVGNRIRNIILDSVSVYRGINTRWAIVIRNPVGNYCSGDKPNIIKVNQWHMQLIIRLSNISCFLKFKCFEEIKWKVVDKFLMLGSTKNIMLRLFTIYFLMDNFIWRYISIIVFSEIYVRLWRNEMKGSNKTFCTRFI